MIAIVRDEKLMLMLFFVCKVKVFSARKCNFAQNILIEAMLYSMTGFGKCVAEYKNKKFTVEVKSLNSKQLDISSRIPPLYRPLEGDMRNIISAIMERGKVDIIISEDTLDDRGSVVLNKAAIADYHKQIKALSQELGIPEPADWYQVLMRFPDVFVADNTDELTDGESSALLHCIGDAVKALMEHRRAEGIKLESFFTQRIEHIREYLGMVPQYESQRVLHIRQRIEDSLVNLPMVEYDKGRLEQEMIYYIEKLDINEEKQRLAQHLDYFMSTMADTHGQGKKLGFIAQEMGREINTLGSKSNQADMQILVVKMKDELEQIKEQVLNVM